MCKEDLKKKGILSLILAIALMQSMLFTMYEQGAEIQEKLGNETEEVMQIDFSAREKMQKNIWN